MKRTFNKHKRVAQLFPVLLASLLGLALFLSPYQLHNNSASIFFVKQPSASEHAGHSEHEHQQQSQDQDIRCLRCVLYGFQLPETVTPFVVILIVLGFLKLAKPVEPVSFIMPSKSARAPPVSL